MLFLLALCVALFAAVHLLPTAPALKARLAAACGRAWGPLYGAAASLGLIAIILAYRASPLVAVYDPPSWGRWVTVPAMAVAFMLFGIFLFRGRARLALRYPFALAVMVWGTAHLFVNGDAAGLILFAGMALYGLAHFVLGWASGIRPEGAPRAGHDLMGPLAGLALFAIMVQLHGAIIGVPVMPLS